MPGTVLLRSLLACLAVLLLALGAAGGYWQFRTMGAGATAHQDLPPAPMVEVAPVRTAAVEKTITAVGTTLSNESVLLRPEVSGRVAAINFVEGLEVRRGQKLIELDSAIERAELQRAMAEQALAQANHGRAAELRRSNVGTQRALDEALSAIKVATAAVDLAKARLAKRTLVAPFDAIAGLRRVSLGDYVTSGDSLVNLEQVDPLKVDFRVPEIFLPALAIGQRLELLLDAFPEQRFEGAVIAIDPLVDAAGRSVIVRARVPNPDGRLRPGLFARVTLKLTEAESALYVPEQAIVPEGRHSFVYLLENADDGPKVRRVEVELGRRRTGEVEVRRGLSAGQRVVGAGIARLHDGMAVRIHAGPSTPARG